MSISVSHARMAESTESPLHRSVFCIRFSVKLFKLVSSPIDVSFPSFGIYSIVVANPRQSSPIIAIDLLDGVSAPIPESRLMEISHSHAELICAYEGVNGVNLRVLRLLQLRLVLLFVCSPFSPSPDVPFLGISPFTYAIFREPSS